DDDLFAGVVVADAMAAPAYPQTGPVEMVLEVDADLDHAAVLVVAGVGPAEVAARHGVLAGVLVPGPGDVAVHAAFHGEQQRIHGQRLSHGGDEPGPGE